jgi:hypothetical protein
MVSFSQLDLLVLSGSEGRECTRLAQPYLVRSQCDVVKNNDKKWSKNEFKSQKIEITLL